MQDIVYINVGWMVEYKGDLDHDPIRGGHEYLRKNGEGHEAFNFAPKQGNYYGHVPGKNNIQIKNFRHRTRDSATGVTVVWVARQPELGRYVIVGWYQNATIFSSPQRGVWKLGRESIDCQIVAPEESSPLVPREQRTFPAPHMPQIAFGRSVIFYGDDDLNRMVMRFIKSNGRWQGESKPNTAKKGAGRQQNPDERRRIEVAAVDHAKAYYREQIGDRKCVTSVENEKKGWDLEVRQRSGELLFVEVKGTSGTEPSAELTVNEYKMLRDLNIRQHYIIYIVTEAGSDNAKSHIFRFRGPADPAGKWKSDDGRVLLFHSLLASRVSIAKKARSRA